MTELRRICFKYNFWVEKTFVNSFIKNFAIISRTCILSHLNFLWDHIYGLTIFLLNKQGLWCVDCYNGQTHLNFTLHFTLEFYEICIIFKSCLKKNEEISWKTKKNLTKNGNSPVFPVFKLSVWNQFVIHCYLKTH